ncbi:MAG: type II secretion system protein GspJ [Candidatus Rokuibacteriota bacterium]
MRRGRGARHPSPQRGEGVGRRGTLAPPRGAGPGGRGRGRGRAIHGFTLVELVLALGIAAAVLVIALGGLRVGLAAWNKGEERTAKLDHARSVVILLERALDGAFPYRLAPERQQEPRILFEGRPDRLTFATLSPPFPALAPIAFTAVSFSSETTGLTLRQQVLPDRLAMDRLAPILVDPVTRAVRFRYLGEEPGAWQDEWDMRREETMPRAVEVTLASGPGAAVPQILTFSLRAAAP